MPAIVVATSVVSILLIAASSRSLRSIAPGTFVPATFAVSAALLFGSWFLLEWSPRLAAQAVYLQISGLGPMLGSGLLAHRDRTIRSPHGPVELRTDRRGRHHHRTGRRARHRTGRRDDRHRRDAAAAGRSQPDLRVADPAARRPQGPDHPRQGDGSGARPRRDVTAIRLTRAGVRAVPAEPGGSCAARHDRCRRLPITSSRCRQSRRSAAAMRCCSSSRSTTPASACSRSSCRAVSAPLVLEKLGLAVTTATPSLALVIGGLGGLIFPGLGGALVARAGESTLRGSLFKTGYEIFFTPIASHDKRAAKSIIDVGFDRLGDAVGGGLIRLLIMLPGAIAVHGAARRGHRVFGDCGRRRAATQPGLHPHARAQPARSRRGARVVRRRRHHDANRDDADDTCTAAGRDGDGAPHRHDDHPFDPHFSRRRSGGARDRGATVAQS